MELTSENVKNTCLECISDNGDTVVKGIIHTFHFCNSKLQENKENIKNMLYQLPEEFQKENVRAYGARLCTCQKKRRLILSRCETQ